MTDDRSDCCDTARCPLCGKDNQCALARGCANTPCWCADVVISDEVLRRIPESARGKACLCRECATGVSHPAPKT
jgi:hypothetical protein